MLDDRVRERDLLTSEPPVWLAIVKSGRERATEILAPASGHPARLAMAHGCGPGAAHDIGGSSQPVGGWLGLRNQPNTPVVARRAPIEASTPSVAAAALSECADLDDGWRSRPRFCFRRLPRLMTDVSRPPLSVGATKQR